MNNLDIHKLLPKTLTSHSPLNDWSPNITDSIVKIKLMRICKRTKHPFLFRRCHSKKRGCCEIWKANELTHGDVYNRGPYVKCNGYQMLPPGFCYIIVQRAKQIFEQPFFHKSSTTSLTTLLTRLCPTFINAPWSESS